MNYLFVCLFFFFCFFFFLSTFLPRVTSLSHSPGQLRSCSRGQESGSSADLH
jgi:hypothetical protein